MATLEELVHMHYDHLNEGDLEIWEYVYNHKEACSTMTIENCAQQCNVSRTTILRFAKKLGLSGYTEFKYLLKSELAETKTLLPEKGINVDQMCNGFKHLLEDIPDRDYQTFNQLMDEAVRVFLVPSGHTQYVAALEIQNLLTVYTTKTTVIVDSRSRRAAMFNTIAPGDLVMFISQSGENEMLQETARELKWMKVPIITFTKERSNPIAMLSDCPVFYPVYEYEGIGDAGYTSIASLYVVIEFYLANYINHFNGLDPSGDKSDQ